MTAYDPLADRYDEHFTRPVDRWEDDWLAALLAPHVNGRDVLDLGCGTGWLLDHLHPSDYTGVDCSAPMLSVLAAKHDHARLAKATVGELGWHEALSPGRQRPRYDVITATWSLEYMGNLRTLLREIRGLARPGAVVALHGSLPRGHRRAHFSVKDAPWTPLVFSEVRHAGSATDLIYTGAAGTGALPDALTRSHRAWEVALSAPARMHYAALWTWRAP